MIFFFLLAIQRLLRETGIFIFTFLMKIIISCSSNHDNQNPIYNLVYHNILLKVRSRSVIPTKAFNLVLMSLRLIIKYNYKPGDNNKTSPLNILSACPCAEKVINQWMQHSVSTIATGDYTTLENATSPTGCSHSTLAQTHTLANEWKKPTS